MSNVQNKFHSLLLPLAPEASTTEILKQMHHENVIVVCDATTGKVHIVDATADLVPRPISQPLNTASRVDVKAGKIVIFYCRNRLRVTNNSFFGFLTEIEKDRVIVAANTIFDQAKPKSIEGYRRNADGKFERVEAPTPPQPLNQRQLAGCTQ